LEVEHLPDEADDAGKAEEQGEVKPETISHDTPFP
jgi:hypothetical protein